MSYIQAASSPAPSASHSVSRRSSAGSAGSNRFAGATPSPCASAPLKHTAPALQGAWFSSGFYGHNRSKPRHDIDFQSSVRQHAMPRPPVSLETRFKVSSRQHPFSQHDNKHTYCNEGIYLGKGMGKKKVAGRSGKFKAEFLHWNMNSDGRYAPRSMSSFAEYPQYAMESTGRSWTLEDGSRADNISTRAHNRGFTAPARLYRPPGDSPTDERMPASNYQRSFCSPSPEQPFSASSSRRSTSRRSSALTSPVATSPITSPVLGSPFASHPVSPPPASGVQSPVQSSTPMAEVSFPAV
eukprot:scpid70076/ scgid8151/ 